MRLESVEWDEAKNALNKRLHHVGFEDVQYVFADPERIERLDRSENNVSGEERWQTIGRVEDIYFAVYTERGETKRLITARLATRNERRAYNGYYQIDGQGWGKAAD